MHHPLKSAKSTKRGYGKFIIYGLIALSVMIYYVIAKMMLPNILPQSSYPRVVVSLTTIPERLPHIRPTLASLLLDQSLSPDVVYLVLPRQDYYTKKTLYDAPWPTFLTEFLETTKLEIIQPLYHYGPITKVLYTLEQEKERSNTRIIYLDDDVQYHPDLVKVLVDGSLQHPNSVVALSGAKWRSNFRQIKHSHTKYNRFPNLFFHISGDATYPGLLSVDLIQGFTGVCVQPTMIHLPLVYQILRDPDLPSAVIKADDLLLSAMMEVNNVTRWIVPGGPGFIKILEISKVKALSSAGMHRNHIETAYYLQQRLNIWKNYDFLDFSKLTPEQLQALDCEASHAQDCDSNVCWPSQKHCPEAKSLFHDLMASRLVRRED